MSTTNNNNNQSFTNTTTPLTVARSVLVLDESTSDTNSIDDGDSENVVVNRRVTYNNTSNQCVTVDLEEENSEHSNEDANSEVDIDLNGRSEEITASQVDSDSESEDCIENSNDVVDLNDSTIQLQHLILPSTKMLLWVTCLHVLCLKRIQMEIKHAHDPNMRFAL